VSLAVTTRLQRFGMGVGARLLAHGHVRDALPYLIKPVNYWRAIEYLMVLEHGRFAAGQRVLDIGSPKLLALYLAETIGASVDATDIDAYFIPRYERVRGLERIPSDRLQLRVEDGRALSYAANSFDRVYSISVVEHIPDDGDSACLAEIARVLKPGGRAVLTVPFHPESRVDFVASAGLYWSAHSTAAANDQVFYQRRYNAEQLRTRLVEPSGLRVVTTQFVGDTVLTSSPKELYDYLPAVSGPVQPLLSSLMHEGPTTDWRTLAKPLCALVVLEKPSGLM
jgi:SAM-dependent methyltransferase